MAKTTQVLTWHKPIKAIGNGWVKFIACCADIGATTYYVGQGMELGDDGEMVIYTTAQPDFLPQVTVAEPIVDDDRFFIAKKKGAEILHNQKLAGTYKIGDAVVQTGTGTWTLADKDTAAHLLMDLGYVVGPADRITATVEKSMVDTFTTTEPVDILI